jgi:hypothetical protein
MVIQISSQANAIEKILNDFRPGSVLIKKRLSVVSLIFICFFLFFLFACADNDDGSSIGATWDRSPENETQTSLPENDDKVTISQGVWGNIWFWEGNHMPSTDKNYSTGEIFPVERDAFIYEVTSIDDVVTIQNTSFYSKINTKLITTTTSDTDGFYEVALQPGSYSIFIKENDLFYANSYNDDGKLNLVTIEEDTVKKYQIDITYQASF